MNFETGTPLTYRGTLSCNSTLSSVSSIPSNISSSPSNNVIHFDAQVSLFKPSKRFFCDHHLTSPSMEESEEEELEEEQSENEEEEEEDPEEEVSESEESENGSLASDVNDSVSIISSIPENVIHFNNQICLFKCSKRYINKQDLAPQSVEMSEEEDNVEEEEEREKEDNESDEDEEEEEDEKEEHEVDEEEESKEEDD